LSHHDYKHHGFKWIDADNASQSIYSYYREDEESVVIIILNMTPVSYESYRIGVPYKGTYTEIINTEKDIYDGCNMCNFEPLVSEKHEAHRFDNSILVRIAPFAGVYLEMKK
jgi:1,4-alpha-glucan branching enzyme